MSVLFADLVGFTTISETRDAEEVRELQDAYFALGREIVGRYGGVIEKFAGDAIMAVWGTPTAHEDDPERAVRTALDLLEGVARLDPSASEPMQARAAILTGEAAVDVGAQGQAMVTGDLVNTASRLQSLAAPGTVLVGDATVRAAGRAIAFEPMGETELRGRTAPVAAWRALRVVAKRGGAGRSDTLEPPFVARQEELRELRDAFHGTAREGRSRLVSITGVGGIGKSRLAWEFLKYVDGLVELVYWHEGRSPAYGDGVAFWALGEMVRQRAGIAETDDAATSSLRLAASLAEHAPDEEERRWIEPRLAHLLGLAPAPAGTRDELFAAWRTYFERIASRAPVVMLFEDLQWADAALLDFIESLLTWSRDVPILVVTLARPELLERRPTWASGHRHATVIHLEPIPLAAMDELVRGLAPGLDDRAVAAVSGRAEGIPLYAVETVRMLLDRGWLEDHEGQFVVRRDLAGLELPESLQGLIAARLDALAIPERAAVDRAAILGQAFTRTSLLAVSGDPTEAIDEALEGLVRREILRVEADPRSPERGQFLFVQAAIREVAYGTLGRRERRRLHLAAARHFETIGDVELAPVLASHYVAAVEASSAGPEWDAVAAQARIALRSAANRAAELQALEQSIEYLETALGLTSDPAERASLSEEIGRVAGKAGLAGRAETALRSAEEQFRALGDTARARRAIGWLGNVLLPQSRVEEATAMLESALGPNPKLDDVDSVAVASQLVRAYMFGNRVSEAAALCERALAAAAKVDDVPSLCELLVTKGWILTELGRYHEAIADYDGAIRLAHENGLVQTELRGRNNLASSLAKYEPRRARELAQEGYEIALRVGDRPWAAKLGGFVGVLGVWTGDWDSAWEQLGAVAADEQPLMTLSSILAGRTLISAYRGEPEAEWRPRYEEHARELLASESYQDRVIGAVALVMLTLALGEWDVVRQVAVRAIDEAASSIDEAAAMAALHVGMWTGDAGLIQMARSYLTATQPARVQWRVAAEQAFDGGVAALTGRDHEASGLLQAAASGLRATGDLLDAVLVEIGWIHLLPDDDAARAGAQRAREALLRLGATRLLARLDGPMPVDRQRATASQPAAVTTDARSPEARLAGS